jgi:hypothetical protein
MAQYIHYQDNIFYITRIVQTVTDAAGIDIDPEYFSERIIADIRYSDQSIRKMRDILSENSRMAERPEYLKLLGLSAAKFAEALASLASGRNELGKALVNQKDELMQIYQAQRMIASEIRDTLSELLDEKNLDVDVVSRDELSELLQS